MNKEAERKIQQLQLIEQNLQGIVAQKQTFQMQLSENENALEVRNVYEFKTRRIEERGAARRLASDQRGILAVTCRPVVVHGFRPWLKRHIGSARETAEAWADFPVALLVGS